MSNDNFTHLANNGLKGHHREGYCRMIELLSAKRADTPNEVENVATLVMSEEGIFITGSDFLMNSGVKAAFWYGECKVRHQFNIQTGYNVKSRSMSGFCYL